MNKALLEMEVRYVETDQMGVAHLNNYRFNFRPFIFSEIR